MSTQDRNTYGDILCQAVDTIVTQRLSALEYDQTILCSIVDDSRREEGIYRVTNGSTVFEAVSDQTNYRNGNNVYVLIPKGNWNETKTITGKKNNKDSEISYIYRNPFDYLVDATNNMIKNPLNDAVGLVANDPNRTEIIIWTYNTADNGILNDDGLDLAGYTRLGIQAQFRSWLNPFYTSDQQVSKVVEGSYGLKLKVTTMGDTTIKDTNTMSKIYELYIDASDMNGNPYDFNTFFQQEKVFDISGFGKILSMELSFYQKPGTFVDAQGIPIPHQGFLNKLVDNNLFIKDPYISLGYDTREFQNDDVIIYTLDTPTFTSAADDSENQKTVQIRWLHEFGEDGKNVLRAVKQEDLAELGATINWYRYRFGAQSADRYSGVYWEYANQEAENRFSYTFDPDVTRADERIKVIIFYNNNDKTSNTVIFTNEKEVVNQATLDATSAVGISCEDGTYGNYRIYNLGNSLLNSKESQINRQFKVYFKESELTEANFIEWIIPKENSMIVLDNAESYLQSDGFYHIKHEFKDNESVTNEDLQSYRIRNYYSQAYSNNTITCIVEKDGITCVGVKELTFGPAGTSGTDATFVLDFDNGINALTKGSTEVVMVTARLYDYNNIEVPINNHDIKWTFKSGTGMSITPQTDKNKVEIKLTNSSMVPNYNILQATLKGFGDYDLIAYLPIPIRSEKGYNYIEGATSLVYNSQGYLDDFYQNPYAIYFNGQKQDNAVWSIQTTENVNFAPQLSDTNKLVPSSIYVKDTNEKVCIIAKINGVTVWSQPLLIIQNRYPAKMVNDWNGAQVIDKANNVIMSARMVAGRKESDNTFSGVMMGDWKGQDAETNITENTGIYGFYHGSASFGFRDDGTAFIGKSGGGRIEFDGNKGIIKSPDSQGLVIDLDDGKITSEKFDLKVGKFNNENEYIYLSSTHSRYPLRIGENFSVEWDGTVTANSGTFKGTIEASSGVIGDCTISNGVLQIKNVNISETLSADKINLTGSITWSDLSKSVQNDINEATDIAEAIANGIYSGGTFIDGTSIYSPNIYGNQISILPNPDDTDNTEGGFSIQGYFGRTLREMFKIQYHDAISAPITNLTAWGILRINRPAIADSIEFEGSSSSPCLARGYIDFSNATVTGLSGSSVAVFG